MDTLRNFITCAIALMSVCIIETSFAGAQKVIVNNGASDPVPVTVQNRVATTAADNPAFQPFAFETSGSFGDQPSKSFEFQVPPNKRLIIETVTAIATLPDGQNASVKITVVTGTDGHTHWLAIQNHGSNGTFTQFQGANQVRLYAEAGSNVLLSVSRDGLSGTANAGVSVSGYLVDVP